MGTAGARDKLDTHIQESVAAALAEDIGSGDLTASLIPANAQMQATVITRERMTMAGRPWFDEVMHQIDSAIRVDWNYDDGAQVKSDAVLCSIDGPARSVLTAERSALNFLQLLSAVATRTGAYVSAIAGTGVDSRYPQDSSRLRLAQKYAVACGGGVNHRIGLFDAILIKENHIMSAGSIAAAVDAAHSLHPGVPVEVESGIPRRIARGAVRQGRSIDAGQLRDTATRGSRRYQSHIGTRPPSSKHPATLHLRRFAR